MWRDKAFVQHDSAKIVVRLGFDLGSQIVLFTMTPTSERYSDDPK